MDTAAVIGLVILTFIVACLIARSQSAAWPDELNGQLTVVRVYRGTEAESYAKFDLDAALMADSGYLPTSQRWIAGQWGAGQFFFALLLCLILIGFLVFLYMLIVKPAGTLTVTYRLQAPNPVLDQAPAPVVTDAAEGRQAIRRLYGV
jgi:hypothetical protein